MKVRQIKEKIRSKIKGRPRPSAPKAGLRINADYERGGKISRKKAL